MKLASNKKAFFDYFIEDRFEAGIELKGCEVKSIKQGKVSIKESHIRIIRNEVFVFNMNVTAYDHGNINNSDEKRTRKLLLNRKEISKLDEKMRLKGYTIMPLNIHTKKGLIKVEIGLAKGKKDFDKRDVLAKKSQNREIERALKDRR